MGGLVILHLYVYYVNNKVNFLYFSLVIDALKIVDGSRKCYRMVGGVLVERTVGDVLPALIANHEQVIFEEFFVLPNNCNTMLFLDLRFIKINHYDQSRQ